MKKFINLINQIIEKKIFYFILFCIIILVMSYRFNYHNIIKLPPQSVHAWRQTDCNSQALNFANRESNLFKPMIHNQVSDDYTTGYCSQEFPIYYYFIGILYKIFGNHDFIFRLANTLLFFISLFYLYKAASMFVKNRLFALIIPFFIFATPIIAFYTNNFIMNIPAISLTFIGWFFFLKFYKLEHQKSLYIALLFFTLASLLKLSEIMSLFVIIGILIFERIPFIKYKDNKKYIFNSLLKTIILIFISFLLIYAWYKYADYYNKSHNQLYYLYVDFDKYWDLDKETKTTIWAYIKHARFYDFFNPIMYYILTFCFITLIVFFKKINKLFFTIVSFYIIGAFCFLMIFYTFLKEHDYYLISLYMLPLFVLLSFVELLSKLFEKHDILKKVFFSITIVGFCLLLVQNINYVKKRIINRYEWEYFPEKSIYGDLFNIKPYLLEIGVKYDDKVICLPDMSPNYSLCLIDRLGWTSYLVNYDAEKIKLLIQKGAKYFIIMGEDPLKEESMKPFLTKQVGEWGKVKIFKAN